MRQNLLITTAVFFVLFIVAVFVLNSVHPLSQVVETTLAFDVKDAEKTLLALTPEGRASYHWFERLDFGFMAIYALMFGFATVTVANWKEHRGARWAWLVVAVPAVACDVVENLTMQSLIDDPSQAALNHAQGWGVAKFVLFAAAFLVPVVWAAHRLLDNTRTDYEGEVRVERTYFSLRLALTLLMGMLIITLLSHALVTQCIRQSISAYYYTPLQVTFVGTLIAVGTCLIVYQGTTYNENILLDIAGFLAFIVAFVPTSPSDQSCPDSIVRSKIVDSGAIPLNLVQYNVYPLLGLTFVATAAALVARHRNASAAGRKAELDRLGAGLGVQAVVIVLACAFPKAFTSVAHWIAASGLFVCIIAVVWSNHLGRREDTTYETWGAKNRYAFVIAYMALILAITAGSLLVDWAYKVAFVEFGLILGFAVFWGFQTSDLKGYANRKEKMAKEPKAAHP